ncbi:reactive oxygen species modulator 1 family protein [Ancylostoma duodenale]|uniref:Reactive oxygen species modulator 1 n=1 Tax=Ancylostoma duodenale TaxID=51022 RepID=A0A0C2BKE3_9BILA|nr:reactive oxygen species modulator 1 family protein [Ancylostoma duodenale]
MPVAAVGGPPGHGQPPTCFQKIRMGFMMGCMIGGATGVLIGGFSALRMGLRGKELLIQTGKIVAQSGGSFGIFMSVAQGLRC